MKRDAGELIEEYQDDFSLYRHAEKHDHYCPRMGGDGRYNIHSGVCTDRRNHECRNRKCSSYELAQTGELVDRATAIMLLKQDKKR